MKTFTPTPKNLEHRYKKNLLKTHSALTRHHKQKSLVWGFITTNAKQTQKLGELLAQELRGGEAICLSGDLGSGKTTFAQGLLKGLRVKRPYTSPTFVIMKKYKNNIFHFDAYRVGAKDILKLGWEEIIADPKNIIIVEWADRIKKIIPKESLWIKFEWLDENKRKISFGK